MEAEHIHRLNTPLSRADWNNAYPAHPFQDNGLDCGVFVCTFAEYLSRNHDFNFDHTHMVSFRQLIAHELTIQRLIYIDPNETNIDEFINRVLNNN